MSYTVIKTNSVPGSSVHARLLDSIHFPPSEIRGVVSTSLTLWEVDRNVAGVFSRSYWKSVFNRKKDYNVVFQQKDPISEETSIYLLHSADKLVVSREGYTQLVSTLTPLVDDCTLLLSLRLLKEIILPVPIKASELVHRISRLMELHPEAHSDWVKVLQALVLVALCNRNDDAEDGQDKVRNVLACKGKFMDMRAADRKGNTALHLVKSESHVKLIMKACESMKENDLNKLVNQKNKDGKNPLHSAFQGNKHCILPYLLEAGGDLCITANDEDESNPLHVAAQADSTDCMIAVHHRKEKFLQKESSCNSEKKRFMNALNATNKKGYTPLMLSVCENYINSVVIFLQAGADFDQQNPYSGNTALHYAAEKGFTPILKALLAFGAHPDIKNSNGKTPLEVARNCENEDKRQECEDELKQMIQLTEEARAIFRKAFEPVKVPRNSIFLLSMDGGGVRGVLLTQALMAIEERIKQLKSDCLPLREYFDYIAGSSSGGLATLSMVHSKGTLEATRASFFKAAEYTEKYTLTFPLEVVERSMQELYGKDLSMADIKHPRVITTTVLADQHPPVLHLLCNYGGSRNGQKPPEEVKVWEAGQSTSAAPFYFPPFDGKFIDGGIMANNPTLDAMAEIVSQEEEEKSGRELSMVLSLGTGVPPQGPKIDNVGIYVPNFENTFTAIKSAGKSLSGTFNFLHLLISQATMTNGQEVARARAWCKNAGISYYRLTPPLCKIVDLAESNKGEITNMLLEGRKYMLRNAENVDEIARILLSRKLY